jgi:hypothetical protein
MGKFHARLYKTDRARDFDHEQVGCHSRFRRPLVGGLTMK